MELGTEDGHDRDPMLTMSGRLAESSEIIEERLT